MIVKVWARCFTLPRFEPTSVASGVRTSSRTFAGRPVVTVALHAPPARVGGELDLERVRVPDDQRDLGDVLLVAGVAHLHGGVELRVRDVGLRQLRVRAVVDLEARLAVDVEAVVQCVAVGVTSSPTRRS